MKQPKIFIIIPSCNGKKFLKECLVSLFNITWPYYQVIIVDNASTDGLPVMVKKHFPKVVMIVNKKNMGFATACNQGAKVAQGEILFFLNSDTLIQESVFQRIIETFKANPNIGIVAPQLVLPDGSLQPWAYGKKEGFCHLVKNKFYPVSAPSIKYPNTQSLMWVSGAAMAIRREIFEKIGGFDEKFFMYFEDKDLCYRVKELGYKIVINNEVKVVHFVGKSPILNRDRKKIYYQAQNHYWRKHYSLGSFILMLFIRWPYKFYILHMKINQNLICF